MKSAGIVVVRKFERATSVLALRSKRDWDLPKGSAEKGEDLYSAAVRELCEETGIVTSDLRWLTTEFFDANYQTRRGKTKQVRFFLGELKDPLQHVLVSKEHQFSQWIPLAWAHNLFPDRFHPVIAWVKEKF